MKKYLITVSLLVCALTGTYAANDDDHQTAVRDIKRAMAMVDAAWSKTIIGSADNMYMADIYDTESGEASGTSDVWPYTAAIEAHCSLLEALNLVKDSEAELYASKYEVYKKQLGLLIDNLEYYRGTYKLASYATSSKECSPYAVPRASERGAANVSGILNVYDDQMWISRELIRAYRLTGTEAWLERATYLVDYVLEGWDCWRDADGNEYGGITWGPGYNSKHACSNAPVIQPLVWLHDIYKDSGKECKYYYRDASNKVKNETRQRADLYLEFAQKVYNWQRQNLLHESGLYWDMMGADNTIKTQRGYRQHVDCGEASGSLFSYNTGTMISGAAELYRATGDETLKTQMNTTVATSLGKFARYVRAHGAYLFNTDESALNGFNTWFNDVLLRSYADAYPYAEDNKAATALKSCQTCLDYAFDNYNRDNMLPIRLFDGWGDEVKTKPFHQFAFASEYAEIATWLLKKEQQSTGISSISVSAPFSHAGSVYTLSGVKVCDNAEQQASLPRGIYVVGNKKCVLGK